MKNLAYTMLLLMFLSAFANSQNLKADYQFQGNLNSSVAGAPALQNLTGSGGPNSFTNDTVDGYTRQTLRFPFNSGLSLVTTGLIPNNAYTVVALFRFDEVSGFRRLAGGDPNFDDGAYVQDGRLEFESTANAPFRQNHYIQVVVVREATGVVRAYRDGGFRVNVPNDGGAFLLNGLLRFFQDDTAVPNEASAGNVARLRVYDGPLTTTQVRALDRVANANGDGDQSILFWSSRDGFSEIYTMNADGGNQKRLTNNEVTEIGGRWSPDRKRIIYMRRAASSGPYDLWIMNADGSGQTEFLNLAGSVQNPSWRPDGAKILFSLCSASFVCDLMTINPNGTNMTALPAPINTVDDEDQATYSPDGTKILFTCSSGGSSFTNPNICVANADGTGVRQQITNTVSPVSNDSASFSPDSARIAFTRRSNSASVVTSEVFVINANVTGLTQLTTNAVYDAAPVWSPDGQRLAFSSEPEAAFVEGYSMNALNGSSLSRLTTNSIADFVTDWYHPRDTPFDFDGDGKTDIGITRLNAGVMEWWINHSLSQQTFATIFGVNTDIAAPADYTGDGKADVTVFRPSTGFWYTLRSEDLTFYAFPFGANGDTPAPGDFDGDGKADATVFRASNQTWYQLLSGGGSPAYQFGAAGDKPVVGDYDGDGKSDIAIFRPSDGSWWIQRSTAGLLATAFGAGTDKAVPGDYTGDGKTDVAVWRPSTGFWYFLRSEDLSYFSFPWGGSGDIPASGDYDGDGKWDASVFRPSDATWYINRSTGTPLITAFGANGDRPIPNSFVP